MSSLRIGSASVTAIGSVGRVEVGMAEREPLVDAVPVLLGSDRVPHDRDPARALAADVSRPRRGRRSRAQTRVPAMMPGVQRAGVTLVVQDLEGGRCIRGRRGRVQMLDRAVPRTVAKGSFGQPEAEYARLIEGRW